MVVRCSATDRELLDLRVGYPARVTLDARPNVSYPAEVTRLASNRHRRARRSEQSRSAAPFHSMSTFTVKPAGQRVSFVFICSSISNIPLAAAVVARRGLACASGGRSMSAKEQPDAD
jgi:hypothetical protein